MKTAKFLFFLVALFLIQNGLNAQTEESELNRLNKKGQKTGLWKKYYPNGKLQYEGFFKNDQPTGKFLRYDRKGNKIAELNHHLQTNTVFAKMYYADGTLKGEGKYVQKKKDSIWNFYAEDGALLNKVPYNMGVKDGTELNYYREGEISEKTVWKQDKKDGKNIQYYPNGKVKIIMHYDNGIRRGEYAVYQIDSKPVITGNYRNNKRHGKWVYYNSEGEIEQTVEYINGVAENQEELERLEDQQIRELEKNKGKIGDPREEMYNKIPPR